MLASPRFALVVATMFTANAVATVCAADDSGKGATVKQARLILQDVLRRREAIQSIEFTATITCDVFRYPTPEVDRAFEGATAKYHFWISPKVSRVDLDEIRPRVPDRAMFERVARVDNVLRFLPCNHNDCVAEELSPLSKDIMRIYGPLFSIDVRSIGLYPDEFSGLQRPEGDRAVWGIRGILDTLDKVNVTVASAPGTVTVSGQPSESSSWPMRWQYTIDTDAMVPVEVRVGWAGQELDGVLKTFWIMRDGIHLPERAEFTQTKDHAPWRHEKWQFRHISVNQPIAEEVASWEAMGLPEESLVDFHANSRQSQRRTRVWRNGAFVAFDPLSRLPARTASNSSLWNWKTALLAMNLAWVGALLGAIGVRRYWKSGL